MEDIVKLAIDAYHGNVEQYSVHQSMDLLRKALIEANGGNTKLDYRAIRDGKCVGLFTLIEEVLSRTVVEGLQGDEYFNALVDFRNLAEGDMNEFVIEDSDLYVVADAADGTQGIRRQRVSGSNMVSIPTTLKVVKIYEELNRVLAGRVDLNKMIDNVGESFRQKLLNDTYSLWASATAKEFGGETYFPSAGVWNEDAMLDLIAHVEAAAGGKPATIIGTKKALRQMKDSIQSDGGKNDLYETGHVGKFYGTNVTAMPQRHQVGSSKFQFPDNMLTVIAGDEKPIKCVYEGDPIVLMGDPTRNGDLTQDYMYGEKYGMGVVLSGGNSGIGRYIISG